MGTGYDLRDHQDASSIEDAFSALVSGNRPGYKTIIERKKIPPKCEKCGRGGNPEQKFCPQCGGKMIIPLTNCPSCKKSLSENEKFCTNCGENLKK